MVPQRSTVVPLGQTKGLLEKTVHLKESLSQTIRLNFKKLKSVFSHQKLKVVKGLPQKDLWVWLSTNGMDPNKVHTRLKNILKELYT